MPESATATTAERPSFSTKPFAQQLTHLPDATRVYPGHEYLARNLEFTLDREPDNAAAAALLVRARQQDPASGLVTTLADEKRMNVFPAPAEPQIIARLRASFPDLGAAPDARTVFLALRKLRNSW
jgi:hydroxyacylglutathione hydrolase